jgi:hypothetical protein
MTDDLVKRLREVGNKNGLMYADYDTTIEAADRIEQLEAALREIAQHDMQAIATDALRPGERIRGEGK